MHHSLFAAALLCAALAAASPARAQETPPVPTPRPAQGALTPPQQPTEAAAPKAAPERDRIEPAAPPPPRPEVTMAPPAGFHRTACPALVDGKVTGRMAEPIADGPCRVDAPLAITAAGGVELGGEAILTCAMATALASLMEEAARLAVSQAGSALASLEAGGGQECRRRNRAATGKLSEHAFANAIDVMAFRLADGRRIVVEEAWPHLAQLPAEDDPRPALAGRTKTAEARFLAAVHAAGCERFTTVLGPDANAAHRDHLHFDLGCHGRDCTARICE